MQLSHGTYCILMTPSLCLPNSEFEHRVRRNTILVEHLISCLLSGTGDTAFQCSSRLWRRSIWQTVWDWEIFGHQTELKENSQLVPGNMLMVKSITADIHHCHERNS